MQSAAMFEFIIWRLQST